MQSIFDEIAKKKFTSYWDKEEQPKEESNSLMGLFGAFLGLNADKINFVKDVVLPTLEEPGKQINEGLAKIGVKLPWDTTKDIPESEQNAIAGGLKIAQGLGTLVSAPFTELDQTLRHVGLSHTANTIAYPFEKISEGVKGGEKILDDIIGSPEAQNNAIRLMVYGATGDMGTAQSLTDKKLNETATELSKFNQMSAQFLAPIALGKGKGFVKANLPKKISPQNIQPYAGEVFNQETGRLLTDYQKTIADAELKKAFTKEPKQLGQGAEFISDKYGNVYNKEDLRVVNDANSRLLELDATKKYIEGEIAKDKVGENLNVNRSVIKEIDSEIKAIHEGLDNAGYNKPKGFYEPPKFEVETPKPKTGIEERTNKKGKKYYYDNDSKTVTSKKKFEEQNKKEQPKVEPKVEQPIAPMVEKQPLTQTETPVEEVKTDIKALEAEYNSKSVEELVALKKKQYPNPDIESAMLPEEKLLNKVIAKKYSDINQQIILKKEKSVEKPVEMPEEIATEFLSEIDSMIGQVKGASKESQGTKFTRENVGKGYEVTKATSGFTYSDFPEWFSRLGKPREDILKALDKIKSGETEGGLVEQLRQIASEHLTEGQTIGGNLFSKGEKTKQTLGVVPRNEKVSMFAEQIGFENLAKAKFPEKTIESAKNKGVEGSPLFEQKTEIKGQENIFDWIFETDKSRENIRKAGTNLQAGFDPTLLKDYVVIGADYFRKGINNYSKWQEQMVKEFGNDIKPHLLKIWAQAKNLAKEVKPEEKQETLKIEPKQTKGQDLSTYQLAIVEETYTKFVQQEKLKGSPKWKLLLAMKNGKDYLRSATGIYDRFIKSIDRQIESVSPKYFRKLTEHDFKTLELIRTRENAYKDFVNDIAKKFSPDDVSVLKLAMLNNDPVKLGNLFEKYKIDQTKLREVLNDIAKESEFEANEFYFPRGVKNYESLMSKFEGMEAQNIFEKLIADKQKRYKNELTDVQKMAVIDNALRGYNRGITLSKLANEKDRVIRIVDETMAEDYHDPVGYLGRYIADMTEMQEARKFFGKGKDGDYKSIGEIILEKISEEKLNVQDANKLRWALYDRFQLKPTPKIVSAVKKAFYLEKLAQIKSSFVQLKDLGIALYRTNPYQTTKAMHEVITGKKSVKLEDLHLLERDIAAEFSDPSKLSKILDENMKWASFSKFDKFGKETFINATLNHYSEQAKSNHPKLNARLKRLFEGEELAQVKNELKNKQLTDKTKLLLFSELTRTQPVSKSSLPAGYHQSPYGRLLYTARTFAIRRLNFIIDEVKSAPTPMAKVRTATRLAMYLGLMGASVDVITNAITGNKLKEEDLDDIFIYNMMDNIGLNRYFANKFGREQFTEIASSIFSNLPIPYVDNIYSDIRSLVKGTEYKANILKSVPVVGRIGHDYLFPKKQSSSEMNLNLNIPSLPNL